MRAANVFACCAVPRIEIANIIGKMPLSKKKIIVAMVAAVRPVVCIQTAPEIIVPMYKMSSILRGFNSRDIINAVKRRPTTNRAFPMDSNSVLVRGDLESPRGHLSIKATIATCGKTEDGRRKMCDLPWVRIDHIIAEANNMCLLPHLIKEL